MALDLLTADGSANVAVRIVIEGLAIELVSDPAMEGASTDDRTRVYCLNVEENPITIDETVNLPDASLEISGNEIRLFETESEDVAGVLWRGPSLVRYLDGTISKSATTLTLLSTEGITAGDYLHIGTECIYVDSVDDATTLSVTRAARNSVALKWWTNIGAELSYQVLTDQPQSLRGRRVYIYLYDEGDDPTGDGTRAWTGLVTSEARISDAGTSFSFTTGSIAEILDADIGGNLGTVLRPRGVYYPWNCPLVISINEIDVPGTSAEIGVHYFTGFYETQNDFVEALSTVLASPGSFNHTTASFGCTYRAIELGDGTWTIEGAVDASATYSRIVIQLSSPCDGESGEVEGKDSSSDPYEHSTPSYLTGELIYPVWASELPGARTAPRGSFGSPVNPAFAEGSLSHPRVYDDQTTYPSMRIYIDSALETGTDAVHIDWPGTGGFDYVIVDLDLTDNFLEPSRPPTTDSIGTPVGVDFPYTALALPEIKAVRTIVLGTLAVFRDALVVESLDYASRGTAPYVTNIDLADWSGPLSAVPAKPYLQDRLYQFSEPTNLKEMLSAEFKLHSMFPIVDADGQISLKPLTHPNPSDPSIVTLDDELITVDWSSFERGNQTYNAISLSRDWDAVKKQYLLGSITVRDVTARSLDQRTRTLAISPKVRSFSGDAQINQFEAAEIFMPWLGLFGYPHDFVTMHVPWTYFYPCLLGQTVSFSADHLPDYRLGRRPVSSIAGIVVSRRWRVGEAHGTLRILVSRANVAGYTPSARVTATSDLGSNLWQVTVNHTKYAPVDDSGSVVANVDTLFSVGDFVRVVEVDTESATIETGEITAINTTTHVITIQFDSAWVPGGGTGIWDLGYVKYDSVQETQRRFAFIADADGLLRVDSTTDNARVYAA